MTEFKNTEIWTVYDRDGEFMLRVERPWKEEKMPKAIQDADEELLWRDGDGPGYFEYGEIVIIESSPGILEQDHNVYWEPIGCEGSCYIGRIHYRGECEVTA